MGGNLSSKPHSGYMVVDKDLRGLGGFQFEIGIIYAFSIKHLRGVDDLKLEVGKTYELMDKDLDVLSGPEKLKFKPGGTFRANPTAYPSKYGFQYYRAAADCLVEGRLEHVKRPLRYLKVSPLSLDESPGGLGMWYNPIVRIDKELTPAEFRDVMSTQRRDPSSPVRTSQSTFEIGEALVMAEAGMTGELLRRMMPYPVMGQVMSTAAANGNVPLLKAMFAAIERAPNGSTLMFRATMPNSMGFRGDAMRLAAYNGHLDIMKALITGTTTDIDICFVESALEGQQLHIVEYFAEQKKEGSLIILGDISTRIAPIITGGTSRALAAVLSLDLHFNWQAKWLKFAPEPMKSDMRQLIIEDARRRNVMIPAAILYAGLATAPVSLPLSPESALEQKTSSEGSTIHLKERDKISARVEMLPFPVVAREYPTIVPDPDDASETAELLPKGRGAPM